MLHSKLAPLYAQSPREMQRCGFLKALMNQYGLWVGLGKRSMTMIDYGCGVGALSQVSEFIALLPFIIFDARPYRRSLLTWWYCNGFVFAVCVVVLISEVCVCDG